MRQAQQADRFHCTTKKKKVHPLKRNLFYVILYAKWWRLVKVSGHFYIFSKTSIIFSFSILGVGPKIFIYSTPFVFHTNIWTYIPQSKDNRLYFTFFMHTLDGYSKKSGLLVQKLKKHIFFWQFFAVIVELCNIFHIYLY